MMENDSLKKAFLIEQTLATILAVNNKLLSYGDNLFKDLTVRQIMAIIAILHIEEDKANINNIAKKLTVSKQSTKSIISSLERKGYVEVVASNVDKRAVNVKVTEEGKNIFINNKEIINKFLTDITGDLTIEEMDTLWTLLKKLYAFDGQAMDGFEENVDHKILKK